MFCEHLKSVHTKSDLGSIWVSLWHLAAAFRDSFLSPAIEEPLAGVVLRSQANRAMAFLSPPPPGEAGLPTGPCVPGSLSFDHSGVLSRASG